MSNNIAVCGGGTSRMTAILEIDGLSLAFGGLQVLRNVRLDVLRGKVTALIGPNGAGKTALLNCISGIYLPQLGRITFDGVDIVRRNPDQIARLGIARSFQNLELFPSLTVLENLLVACDNKFHGGVLGSAIFFGPARRSEIAQREAAERVIDFFELWPMRHVRAYDLPYGQQKIVGFARAMAADSPPSSCSMNRAADARPATRRRISHVSFFACGLTGRFPSCGSSTTCRW